MRSVEVGLGARTSQRLPLPHACRLVPLDKGEVTNQAADATVGHVGTSGRRLVLNNGECTGMAFTPIAALEAAVCMRPQTPIPRLKAQPMLPTQQRALRPFAGMRQRR